MAAGSHSSGGCAAVRRYRRWLRSRTMRLAVNSSACFWCCCSSNTRRACRSAARRAAARCCSSARTSARCAASLRRADCSSSRRLAAAALFRSLLTCFLRCETAVRAGWTQAGRVQTQAERAVRATHLWPSRWPSSAPNMRLLRCLMAGFCSATRASGRLGGSGKSAASAACARIQLAVMQSKFRTNAALHAGTRTGGSKGGVLARSAWLRSAGGCREVLAACCGAAGGSP